MLGGLRRNPTSTRPPTDPLWRRDPWARGSACSRATRPLAPPLTTETEATVSTPYAEPPTGAASPAAPALPASPTSGERPPRRPTGHPRGQDAPSSCGAGRPRTPEAGIPAAGLSDFAPRHEPSPAGSGSGTDEQPGQVNTSAPPGGATPPDGAPTGPRRGTSSSPLAPRPPPPADSPRASHPAPADVAAARGADDAGRHPASPSAAPARRTPASPLSLPDPYGPAEPLTPAPFVALRQGISNGDSFPLGPVALVTRAIPRQATATEAGGCRPLCLARAGTLGALLAPTEHCGDASPLEADPMSDSDGPPPLVDSSSESDDPDIIAARRRSATA